MAMNVVAIGLARLRTSRSRVWSKWYYIFKITHFYVHGSMVYADL